MMVVGAVPYVRCCLVAVSQILGGVATAGVIQALALGPLYIGTTVSGVTPPVGGSSIKL